MTTARNQSSNIAAKAYAEKKVLNWLPFGEPGWPVERIANGANLNPDRAVRAMRRLIDKGLVARAMRRIDHEYADRSTTREYHYWRVRKAR